MLTPGMCGCCRRGEGVAAYGVGPDGDLSANGAQTLRWVVQSHPAVGSLNSLGRERSGREIVPSQDLQPRLDQGRQLSRDSLSRESEAPRFEDIDPDRQLFQHFQEPAYRFVGDQKALAEQRQSDPCRCWSFSLLFMLAGLVAALLCYRHIYGAPPSGSSSLESSQKAYDCDVGDDNWLVSWSLSKRGWCCKHYRRGCPNGQASSTTLLPTLIPSTEASGTSAPFNCMNGLFNWAARWSQAKKTYCCTHGWQGGCSDNSALDSSSLRSSNTVSHPGQNPAGNGDLFRSSAALPAKPDSAALSAACESACTVHGMDAPCLGRMKFAALHEFSGQREACHKAEVRVIGECSACRDCRMELVDEAFCTGLKVTETPAPTTTPRPTTTTVATTRQETTTTPPLLQTAAPGERYDCFERFKDWEQAWSVGQKAWCCQHHQRGCPNVVSVPFNCFTGIQDQWSHAKRKYCCAHSGAGCTTEKRPKTPKTYDCQDHLSSWIDHWSLAKKEWCCERVHCPTM